MSGHNDRAHKRELIRESVLLINTRTPAMPLASASRPVASDPMAAKWALVHLTSAGVMAICNLAETIDARGAGIRDTIRDPAGDW